MFTFLGQLFSSIFLILATIVNSIIPLFAGNSLTDDRYYDKWSADDAYVVDYDSVIQKDPDEDLNILVITDVQLNGDEVLGETRFKTEELITKLVNKTDPDLIVVVGDNAIGIFAYHWFVEFMDSFNIPWAPVMGNHDGQGLSSESWAAYKMIKADNCLFKFGPEDMGHGNYTVQIRQGNKFIHTLYLMDTHDSTDYIDGDIVLEDVYDGLWKNQIEWYKWNVNGLNELTNSTVESTLFIHIPLPEYNNAYEAIGSDPTAFGQKSEYICCSGMNTGMFDVLKELGSTKNVICGHDHVNNFSTNYQGIRLSYATKTGTGSYHDTSIQGGSLLTIDENGTATFSHIDAATL
ncbi:MAG: metallophosphoesterase [Clostridia bacterium]|nr:metallophosphoesterase [Clostridia bacterium]